jgi:hypothetical protein
LVRFTQGWISLTVWEAMGSPNGGEIIDASSY